MKRLTERTFLRKSLQHPLERDSQGNGREGATDHSRDGVQACKPRCKSPPMTKVVPSPRHSDQPFANTHRR